VIEIIDSIPSSKLYFKDSILEGCGQLLESMWNYLLTTTLADLANETQIFKHKLANHYTLRLLLSFTKNHPASQNVIFSQQKSVYDKLYELTQAKYKDRSLTVLANDIIESLTNKNHQNEQSVSEYLMRAINQKKEEQKSLA
jgi:galactokinase/mevalonate kinase-like predicted kinase